MKTKNITTPPTRKSIGRSALRCCFFLISLVLGCFALSPASLAQLPGPTPDGGYPGNNTAEGTGALQSLTIGFDDTATGYQALYSNTTGFYNTATGYQALLSDTEGFSNTATGINALEFNTAGNGNTATGVQALLSNTIGNDNTATGVNALFFNTTGFSNTATGVNALSYNATGQRNTATGFGALEYSTLGNDNTATGDYALEFNTTGSGNIALGVNAGFNLTTGNKNIDIGNKGVARDNSTIRIGTSQSATFIAGISGAAVAGTAVHVNADGQLGTAPSSERFKDEIKPMDKASEAIHALKPVTFRYKKELDPEGIPQFGLVAEDVATVNPDLVVRDGDGKVYTVRYEAVNAMLLNEFLKEHSTVQELKKEIAALAATVKDQTAQIQKVSAQIEVTKPAPQVVGNSQ